MQAFDSAPPERRTSGSVFVRQIFKCNLICPLFFVVLLILHTGQNDCRGIVQPFKSNGDLRPIDLVLYLHLKVKSCYFKRSIPDIFMSLGP